MIIKNLLVAAFATFAVNAWTRSLTQVPTDLLLSNILPRMLPGSLGRLGLTCKFFHSLAHDTLKFNYGSSKGVDVELLYNLYKHVHDQEDEFETGAIRRLIQANFPPITGGGFAVQHRYEFVQAELFNESAIPFAGSISKYFPEVSRIVLRHKKFINQKHEHTIKFCRPEFIDALNPRLDKISHDKFVQYLRKVDPRLFVKMGFLAPEEFQEFLLTGDYQLVRYCEGLDADERFALVLGLATEENMPQILKLVDGLPVHHTFHYPYVQNWIRYPHLHPAVQRILETTNITNNAEIAVAISRLEDPIDLYISLISPEIFVDIKKYLISFDESSKRFTKLKPAGVSPDLILQTAMFMHCPVSFLLAVLKREKPHISYHMILVACHLRVDDRVILKMLRLLPRRTVDDPPFMFTGKMPMSPTVFGKFMNIYTGRSFKVLFDFLDKSTPIYEHLKVLQKKVGPKAFERSFLDMSEYEKCADAAGVRQSLYKYALENGLVFWWSKSHSDSEPIEFFDGIKDEQLRIYMSKSLNQETRRSFFGCSFYFACCSLAKRPGGHKLLEKHFEKEVDYSTLQFVMNFPDIDESSLVRIAQYNPGELSLIMFHAVKTPSMYPALDRIIEMFRAHSKNPLFLKFFRTFIESCIAYDFPAEKIFPLSFFKGVELRSFLQQCKLLEMVSGSKYYSKSCGLKRVVPQMAVPRMLSD